MDWGKKDIFFMLLSTLPYLITAIFWLAGTSTLWSLVLLFRFAFVCKIPSVEHQT
jgi:hypothetical protein